MSDFPQVAAVAPGSPADKAGIRPGDELLALDGAGTDALYRRMDDPRLLADEIVEQIASRPTGPPVTLRLRRGMAVTRMHVRPVSICSARAILMTDRSVDAYSDERNMAITTAMAEFAIGDDELALILGHELAHVIFRDRKDAPLARRRAMEDRADLFGAALAHCAGYNVVRAADFWPRYGKRDGTGWSLLPTHRSPGERARRILATVNSLACPVSLPPAAAPAAPK